MATLPNDIALGLSGGELPFASYAQIVRMLVPLAGKIAFYNERGDALWISDDIEEPELRERIEGTLASGAGAAPPVSFDAEAIYVIPIRDLQRRIRGLLAIMCRQDRTQRGLATIERLLAPLIEILSHAWRHQPSSARTAPTAIRLARPAEPTSTPTPPWPALLRHALLLGAQRIDCAFAAVVAAERPFTFSHRANSEASDLEVSAAVSSVAPHMIKLMQTRTEPVLANKVTADRVRAAPFKFLVHPIRNDAGRLLAVIMLFRSAGDRDFVRWDLEALSDVCAQLPSAALAELAPTAPPPAPPTVAPTPIRRDNASAAPKPQAQPSAGTPSAAPAAATPTITIERRLRAALEADAFELHVQRISPLAHGGGSLRHEVLLRLKDADRLWPPRAFLGAAESCGLMPDLDQWVVRTLLKKLRAHGGAVRATGLEFCINLGLQSLNSSRFIDFLVAEICRSSIPPGLLVFEVSEASAMTQPVAVASLGARLRDLGCRLALDNCRAGFETLNTVRQWPVSCVKLDGSLVRTIVADRRAEAMLRAVVQLASGAGVETVGECVESLEICTRLHELGVDFAQGFHLAQPQPLEQLFRR